MTTDQRIENLEKGLASARRLNRWLLAAVGLAAAVFGVVWIGAAAGCNGQTPGGRVATVIRAGQFVLEDENGKTRATLALTVDGPMLGLTDETGNPRAILAVFKSGPRLGN